MTCFGSRANISSLHLLIDKYYTVYGQITVEHVLTFLSCTADFAFYCVDLARTQHSSQVELLKGFPELLNKKSDITWY